MAQRIQRKREKGWRAPDGLVIVSRPSLFSNPYRVGHEAKDNAEAVAFFERDLIAVKNGRLTTEMMRAWRLNSRAGGVTPFYIVAHVKDLAGKDLACWCALDQPCHADVLLRMANEEK
jgi:hypothetical protein